MGQRNDVAAFRSSGAIREVAPSWKTLLWSPHPHCNDFAAQYKTWDLHYWGSSASHVLRELLNWFINQSVVGFRIEKCNSHGELRFTREKFPRFQVSQPNFVHPRLETSTRGYRPNNPKSVEVSGPLNLSSDSSGLCPYYGQWGSQDTISLVGRWIAIFWSRSSHNGNHNSQKLPGNQCAETRTTKFQTILCIFILSTIFYGGKESRVHDGY